MPRYKYIAAAPGTPPEEVDIEADSPAEAAAKLRSRRLTPVRFCGESDEEAGQLRWLPRRRVDSYEFTSQLAPLLSANIPLERALAIIAESTRDEEQKRLANTLRQGLHEGKKFSELIRSYGSVFPGFYANLIETGEETGCLPEVVEQLQSFMAESKELREFIVSSSIYPAAVLAITLLVTILMFTVFVPRFAQIFTDMGREQPGSMVFLMTLSSVLSWACWMVPAGILAGYWLLRWKFGAARLREWRSQLAIRVPIFGKLLIEIEMGKFMRTLAILVSNHVDIIRTVRISIRVIQNQVIRASFSDLERRLKGGEKLSASLSNNPFLPPGLASKIRVGEESGTVGPMLTRSADHIEEGTRRKVKRLLSLFEPVVIVFLAMMVLIVVVSIFMAIMELNEVG